MSQTNQPEIRRPNVVLFPGAFNPPTLGHVEAVKALKKIFDQVVIIPLQPDEWSSHDGYEAAPDYEEAHLTRFISPVHHAAMADLAFSPIPRVTVDLEYLESQKHWKYSEILENFSHKEMCYNPSCPFGMADDGNDDDDDDENCDVTKSCDVTNPKSCSDAGINDVRDIKKHVSCLCAFGSCKCEGKVVPEIWSAFGEDVLHAPHLHPIVSTDRDAWEHSRFAVFQCEDNADMGTLPPHSILLAQVHNRIRSSEVRAAVYNTEDISAMVPQAVREYISSFMLYRGVPQPTTMPYVLGEIRAIFYCDSFNPVACEVKKTFEALEDKENPNVIFVIGGDGTMIRAIREHWRRRLPFFGINCGHLGFLHNELNAAKVLLGSANGDNDSDECSKIRCGNGGFKAVVHYLPLLRVECTLADGSTSSDICFNDTWIERGSGQSAWVKVSVNDEVKIEKLVGDGVLVSTAAGSTAYAQAMGCCPIPVGTPLLCLTGSNVSMPLGWRPAYLPLSCNVSFEGLNLEKRPLKGFVDGVDLGLVKKMNVRTSNVGNCRLIFLEPISLLSKLSKLQFP